MPPISTVFARITSHLFPTEFARCAGHHPMPRSSRSFSGFDHFLALCFGHLTGRESLRDIVTCLAARRYGPAPATDGLPELVFALDASIIHLSLKLFPWAFFPRSKAGALKLHLLLAVRGSLPTWAALTEATFAEQKMLDEVPVQPGAFYVLDRGYLDFTRLIRWPRAGAFFVVRNKCHVRLRVLASRLVDKSRGLRCDQTVRLCSPWSRGVYPEVLRRVRYRDPVQQRSLVFLTNHFDLGPEIICELYRRRWQVELFFKWMKQHLRVRQFYGRSENAVRCQIWAAISSYLLVARARKELGVERSLY